MGCWDDYETIDEMDHSLIPSSKHQQLIVGQSHGQITYELTG